jgi:hypothetical protein
MRPTKLGWLLALLVTLSPCHLVTLSSAKAAERLLSGMTPDQVRQILGPPRRIGRQILYQRYIEQWVYDTPRPLRLEFDCRRGQLPSLLLPPAAPPAPPDGVPMPGRRAGG